WVIGPGIKVIVILFLALVISKVAKVFVSRAVRTVVEKSNGQIQKERAKTLSKVFSSTLKIMIWVIAILMLLPEIGINPTPLLAGAGLIGLAIGMGSRSLVQDYLAGLFILLEDQYRVGEEVDISGKKGHVIDLNLRRTIIKDEEGIIHYIPNGQVKTASNLSRKIS
ncbi:mechanosensitive ion channel family protein, partial [Patescibacteria group bacterium]|nr:mechanosensitive ion channel family protein [Patescibacteria group bacterium]